MPKLKILGFFCLIPILLSFLAGQSCSSKAPSVIRIGAFVGLTGNISVYGQSQKKGMDLAVEELNSSNFAGPGQTLKVFFADTSTSSEGAIGAIQSLIDQKVSGLIGPTLSSQAFAADPLAQKNQIPVIAISNTVPNIVEMGDYIFRCSLPESAVITGTVKTAADMYRVKKLGLLWGSDQDLTIAGHQAFLSAAGAYGLEVVDDQSYKTGDASFETQLTHLISLNPDAIGAAALAGDAVQILLQARALGFKGTIIGSNGFNSPDLIKQAGPAAEGLMVGTAWNKDSTSASNQAFISAFEKKYGAQPDQFAAQSYTAVKLFAKAVVPDWTSDPKQIREGLAAIRSLPTPLGDFSFTDQREPVSPAAVQIVRNGELVIINR